MEEIDSRVKAVGLDEVSRNILNIRNDISVLILKFCQIFFIYTYFHLKETKVQIREKKINGNLQWRIQGCTQIAEFLQSLPDFWENVLHSFSCFYIFWLNPRKRSI